MVSYQSVVLRHNIFIGKDKLSQIVDLLTLAFRLRIRHYKIENFGFIIETEAGNSIRFGNDFISYALQGDFDKSGVLKAIVHTATMASKMEEKISVPLSYNRFNPNLVSLGLTLNGGELRSVAQFYQQLLYRSGDAAFIDHSTMFGLFLGTEEELDKLMLKSKGIGRLEFVGKARNYDSIGELVRVLSPYY